jgi:hypothetical protein
MRQEFLGQLPCNLMTPSSDCKVFQQPEVILCAVRRLSWITADIASNHDAIEEYADGSGP